MRCAKSIDELYEEVKDFDIVLTNDAALATALNAKIDKPRIGGFAYTPRHIAGNEAIPVFGAGVLTDLQIISEIANETGLSFKYIHSELENIRTIRRYKKDVPDHLYTRSSKEVYSSFLCLRTVEKLMGEYDPKNSIFFDRKKTAVIGIELFDDLDKHFIPADHKEIDPFKEGSYGIETIYEVGNDRQLAENTVSLITKETANDTAIVLDSAGPIADAVRAALYRKGIGFKNVMSVKDLTQVRDYLQFLSLSLSYETIRVRHVRELYAGYEGYINQKEDDYFLNKVEPHLSGRAKVLAEVMGSIRERTFHEICERIVRDVHRPQITMLLDDMKIKNVKVTSKLVNELTYAVNSISDLRHNEEIPENEKKGVLLADCGKSTYVDRPFVIYLGMGPEWSRFTPGKNYIDMEAEAEKNMYRFSLLLQQGVSRLYAVNSMRGGKGSIPCPVFEQIKEYYREPGEMPKAVSGFKDISKNYIGGQWAAPVVEQTVTRGAESTENTERKEWKFYKSTYNQYAACPRAYMYGSWISMPDNEQSIFGIILHDFAEFYLCYPEIVKGKVSEFTDSIRERYSGMSSQEMREIDSSKIRVSMTNIIRFIDSLKLGNVPLDRDNSQRKYKNIFMEANNCEKYSSITESELTSDTYPVSGKVDLIIGNRIIDYKTGKANKASDIRKKMDITQKQDYFELQPIMYLSLLKEKVKPPCIFSLFYVTANDVQSVTDENFSIYDNIRDVFLIEETMEEFIRDPDSPVKSIFSAAKYEKIVGSWTAFVDKAFEAGTGSHEKWKGDKGLISSVMSVLGLKDNKTNSETVSYVLEKVSGIISEGMISGDKEIIIPSDAMEGFLSRLERDHAAASDQRYDSFPAAPRISCKKCNFYKACTEELIDLEEGEADE